MAENVISMLHPAPPPTDNDRKGNILPFANKPDDALRLKIARAREAQLSWAGTPVAERRSVVRKARHIVAAISRELAATVPLEVPSTTHRNLADSLVAEVLPLAEACRFLEREAERILRPRNLGRHGRPIWLGGVEAQVHRAPLGIVLLIAPANYPLFLPGVQALQALVAGNAVLWKPAVGGDSAARALKRVLLTAGLPEYLLQVLDTSAQAGLDAIRIGVDKVFLTGHADTGRAVMHELASSLTPSVMELSGCDAVFILPDADLDRAAEALAFGMRLNGSATCMAPRRVFGTGSVLKALGERLLPKLNTVPPATASTRVQEILNDLIADALRHNAELLRDGRGTGKLTPTLLRGVQPNAAIMQTDIFAPVLAFCDVPDMAAALAAQAASPYALTAAIFGNEREASSLAAQLRVGTVLINDLIVTAADPRVPFGGRGSSGFGATRGREGLLEMTAPKTVLRQTSRSLRPYATTGPAHEKFFAGFIEAAHSGSPVQRYRGLRELFTSARAVNAQASGNDDLSK